MLLLLIIIRNNVITINDSNYDSKGQSGSTFLPTYCTRRSMGTNSSFACIAEASRSLDSSMTVLQHKSRLLRGQKLEQNSSMRQFWRDRSCCWNTWCPFG